ncbi:MAG: hypothetical protein KC442_14485 [Thermomicrobiales bacterium]|nr:hypothetical protein [Thermomicrobiales bacterium]
MDQQAVITWISALPGIEIVATEGDAYFFADPSQPAANRLPFATVMTSDRYDQFSQLDRPGVYRLNLGVSPATFRGRFGPTPFPADPTASGHDFAALDTIMPHPVYGSMFWLCVLNPSDTTFTELQPLLEEARQVALTRARRASPGGRR